MTNLELFRQCLVDLGMGAAGVDEIELLLIDLADNNGVPISIQILPVHPDSRTILDVTGLAVANMKATEQRSIEIKPGTTLLYGPNDSGKSTLLAALGWALSGGPVGDLPRHGANAAAVLVNMSDGYIERKVFFDGKDPTYSLGFCIGKTPVHGGQQQIQAAMQDWMRVAPSFIQRVALVRQSDVTDLIDDEPGRRKENFFKMLGLDCEPTRKALAAVLKRETLDAEHDAANRKMMSAAKDSAVEHLSSIDTASLEARLTEVQKHQARLQDQRQLEQQKADLLLDVRRHAEQATRRASLTTQLEELRAQWTAAKFGPAECIDGMKARRESLALGWAALKTEIEVKGRELALISEEGNKIKAMPAACPTCLELGVECKATPEVRARKLSELRKKYLSIQGHQARQQVELERIKTEIGTLDSMVKEASTILDAANQKKHEISILLQNQTPDRQDELKEVETRLAGLEMVKPVDITSIKSQIAEAVKLKAAIEQADKVLAKPMPDQHRLEGIGNLVKLFSKDGIPMLLARRHLAAINGIAAELADGDAYQFSFGEDLEVLIQKGDEIIDPKHASESSRQRGALILRASMGIFLQETAGVKIPLLWIDELPYQDEINQVHMVSAIKGLARHYSKVVFATSSWERYLGQFDHEVSLCPPDVVRMGQELVTELQSRTTADSPKKGRGRRKVTKKEADAAAEKLHPSVTEDDTASPDETETIDRQILTPDLDGIPF